MGLRHPRNKHAYVCLHMHIALLYMYIAGKVHIGSCNRDVSLQYVHIVFSVVAPFQYHAQLIVISSASPEAAILPVCAQCNDLWSVSLASFVSASVRILNFQSFFCSPRQLSSSCCELLQKLIDSRYPCSRF